MGNTHKAQLKLSEGDPLQSLEQFREYIAAINQIIKSNDPFLNASLSCDSLNIDVVAPEPNFLLDFFVKNRMVEKATVMVQYTLLPVPVPMP